MRPTPVAVFFLAGLTLAVSVHAQPSPLPPTPLGAPSNQILIPAAPPAPQPGVVTSPVVSAPAVPAPIAIPAVEEKPLLLWDAERKELTAKEGEFSLQFTFHLTNASPAEVLVNGVRTSCGCTVAQLPSIPWRIPPGGSGPIGVAVDLRGKQGAVIKSVYVDTSVGPKTLLVHANIPAPTVAAKGNGMGDRTRNIQMALGDRQAVFKNDCVSCHVEPARGKRGHDLYVAACGICHEAEHRAAMVPDLRKPKTPRNEDYWREWITNGKAGTLMPAFALNHGGPLTQEQVTSLVAYLHENFPKTPEAGEKPQAAAKP